MRSCRVQNWWFWAAPEKPRNRYVFTKRCSLTLLSPGRKRQRALDISKKPAQCFPLESNSHRASFASERFNFNNAFAYRLCSRAFGFAGSPPPIPADYKLKIATGNRRGAGTTAQVFVELIGKNGRTGKLNLDGSFIRDSVVEKTITWPQNLGEISALRIGHDCSGDQGAGWFLDSVELEYSPPKGVEGAAKELRFPVGRWLGQSDFDCQTTSSHMLRLRVGMFNSMTDPALHKTFADRLEDVHEPLFIETGVTALPHPGKVRDGEKALVQRDYGQAGEDAYSIAVIEHPYLEDLEKSVCKKIWWNNPLPRTVTISVADGIYSWRSQGIDSGEFSRYLVDSIRQSEQYHIVDDIDLFRNRQDGQSWQAEYKKLNLTLPAVPLRHPRELLMNAENLLRASGLKGSSTACVVSIHGLDRKAYISCLGDSGVAVCRPGFEEFLFRTPEQEHQFGYPYQLGHHDNSDAAMDALCYEVPLRHGDVIIVATDGLFDNVEEKNIVKIVKELTRKSKRRGLANSCARELAKVAFYNSIGSDDTPYSAAASEAFNLVFRGGKKDDITVTVAIV